MPSSKASAWVPWAWIAGLVNAYPKESVKLFELARDGGPRAAESLYAWLLPLLRLETVPTFVQLIKLCRKKSAWAASKYAHRDCQWLVEREYALKVVIDLAVATKPSV
jgi:dihydrodipicolinate synthase/N-acetylneuraminate lyase